MTVQKAGSIKTEFHSGCIHKKREISFNLVFLNISTEISIERYASDYDVNQILYQLDHKQQWRIKSDLWNLDLIYIFLQRQHVMGNWSDSIFKFCLWTGLMESSMIFQVRGSFWPFTHNWNSRIRFFEKTVTMIRSGKYVINNGCSFVFVNFKYFNGK